MIPFLLFAEVSWPETGWLERVRQSGTLGIPAVRKLFERAVLPVEGTAVDILPFVVMFGLLAAGAFLTLKLKNRQKARRAVQVCSALAFVVGVHPCMCMVRDVTFGALSISINTLEAFKYLMIFSVVAAFGLIYGRIFCGWICPLGFFQEMSSTYYRWARRHRAGGLLSLAGIGLAAAVLVSAGVLGLAAVTPFVGPAVILLSVYLLVPQRDNFYLWARWGLTAALLAYIAAYFFILRPGTFRFIETVAVWWVMALLVLALFVVGDSRLDERFKRLKFVSLGLMVLIITVGVYTNGPFCIFFQSVVDLSTVLSAMGILALSGILSNAWCRYLCPEGAILGWLARNSRWKITKLDTHCSTCRVCDTVCPVEAIHSGERDETTCIFCSRCIEACPTGALILEDVGRPARRGRPPGFVPVQSVKLRRATEGRLQIVTSQVVNSV